MTFSFKPRKKSCLPLTAASFNTFVVSWKEAAEMNDLVCNEARVIPWSNGRAVAGMASRPSAKVRSRLRSELLMSRNWRAEIMEPNFKSSLSPLSVITTIPKIRLFSTMKSFFSANCFSKKRESPASSTTTFFIIWRTMTSKCLSLIFTPCKRYTSWISFTMYSCTAVGPMISKISIGVIAPSDSGMPARTKSLSCTKMCFDNGTKYL